MPPGTGRSLTGRDPAARQRGADGLALGVAGVAGGAGEFDRAGLGSVTVAPQLRWRALDVEAATVDGSARHCRVHAGTAAELGRWAFPPHRTLRRYAPHTH
ncbi:hypothetical protein O7599_15095 [Streptomyces sp. WMMC500]|uniref:hypothetical protein n=1 Tax=Streptomyces sp. WMMC500 TaxID=3015154 RepID=UPI00248AE8E5|nr:hypothetical protein [Streptomyces sp. WMMC500]WBB63762.1 hypothetical protein O7599_15095 [Streptomyces sp. WMMC500]